jgi:protein MBA1
LIEEAHSPAAGTFVTPDRQKLPSYFRSPRTRIKLEYQRIQAFLRDRFSLLVLKFASPRDLNRRFGRSIKLQNSQLVPTALALHREMYTAFAEADLPTLRRLCTDGLYDSFRARIGSRPRGEQVVWELTDYKKPARLVSNRAARFPIDGSAVRQAVVRIWSRQKLTRYAANGTEVGGAGKVKDIVEYVVVQKIYSQWKADEWQVWGTTKETQLENIGPKEP